MMNFPRQWSSAMNVLEFWQHLILSSHIVIVIFYIQALCTGVPFCDAFHAFASFCLGEIPLVGVAQTLLDTPL